jgi:hypothetical protein
MIFFDETGRRWKRIKYSITAAALLTSLPVIALIGGSLAYQPHWGSLPIIKQVAGAVLPHSSNNQPGPSSSSTGPASEKTSASQTTKQLVYKPNTNNSSTSSTPQTSNTTSTTQPPSTTTIPTQAQSTYPAAATVSPTGGNPAQNDFGQSHRATR